MYLHMHVYKYMYIYLGQQYALYINVHRFVNLSMNISKTHCEDIYSSLLQVKMCALFTYDCTVIVNINE